MTLIGNRALAAADLWSVCSVIFAMISASGPLCAQQPTQAQINAIREACRADYQEHCAGVPAGGAPALACLQKNVASVSEACQRAVNAADVAPTATQPAAVAPTPAATASTPTAPPSEARASTEAPAAAPPAAKAAEPASTRPSKAQISHIRQACRADYRAHCAGVTAGASGLACLKDNVASLSAPCRLALGDAAVGNTPQAPPAPTVSDELPVVSPREEIFIMRSACGPDFRTYCEGLRPGGGRIIGCLQANRASLSPRCQRALLALRTRR
jgi:hypothetical protein